MLSTYQFIRGKWRRCLGVVQGFFIFLLLCSAALASLAEKTYAHMWFIFAVAVFAGVLVTITIFLTKESLQAMVLKTISTILPFLLGIGFFVWTENFVLSMTMCLLAFVLSLFVSPLDGAVLITVSSLACFLLLPQILVRQAPGFQVASLYNLTVPYSFVVVVAFLWYVLGHFIINYIAENHAPVEEAVETSGEEAAEDVDQNQDAGTTVEDEIGDSMNEVTQEQLVSEESEAGDGNTEGEEGESSNTKSEASDRQNAEGNYSEEGADTQLGNSNDNSAETPQSEPANDEAADSVSAETEQSPAESDFQQPAEGEDQDSNSEKTGSSEHHGAQKESSLEQTDNEKGETTSQD